ncbi:MAG: FemAB family protein, partial [Terrimicrobiaceae bacterium]
QAAAFRSSSYPFMNSDFENLASSLIGERVSLRRQVTDQWDEALKNCAYIPVFYTSQSIDYQLAYQTGQGGDWQDLSSIIFWNNQPCAVWPLSRTRKGGMSLFDSHGLPTLPPLFRADLPATVSKRLTKGCLDVCARLAREMKCGEWQSAESFTNESGLGSWHSELMRQGATCRVGHELYLDLQPDLATIKSGFRKSYKSLVSSGLKQWSVNILQDGNESVWNEFINLHLEVSGRKTRSDESWEIQRMHLQEKADILIYLRDSEERMVGGGLFQMTRDEALYAVAAYDRSLFHKPLGHVVQFAAIEEFKRRGIRWYKIGARAFPGDQPAPSEKEISISEFKSGFASHLFPRYLFSSPVSPDEGGTSPLHH